MIGVLSVLHYRMIGVLSVLHTVGSWCSLCLSYRVTCVFSVRIKVAASVFSVVIQVVTSVLSVLHTR